MLDIHRPVYDTAQNVQLFYTDLCFIGPALRNQGLLRHLAG